MERVDHESAAVGKEPKETAQQIKDRVVFWQEVEVVPYRTGSYAVYRNRN